MRYSPPGGHASCPLPVEPRKPCTWCGSKQWREGISALSQAPSQQQAQTVSHKSFTHCAGGSCIGDLCSSCIPGVMPTLHHRTQRCPVTLHPAYAWTGRQGGCGFTAWGAAALATCAAPACRVSHPHPAALHLMPIPISRPLCTAPAAELATCAAPACWQATAPAPMSLRPALLRSLPSLHQPLNWRHVRHLHAGKSLNLPP